MPDPKAKLCPFCKKPPCVEVGKARRKGLPNFASQVFCERHGPGSNIRFFGSTLAIAIQRWNQRAEGEADA